MSYMYCYYNLKKTNSHIHTHTNHMDVCCHAIKYPLFKNLSTFHLANGGFSII